ncbi:hypothetical protein DFH07DRAFT_728887 [Mycena maculata]|uniref:Cryptic loci regulator 2 N-terminal domain-containing protein n=1 Tax=Mycena maculata TaxID=230809 RepID=A0AAD7NZQ1_9AGAR|nr:hypothetical protein DFH07DRAFT_728887 [Mycena maculata]
MSHRSHSTKHALPANPSWVDFPRSDGDPRLWPTNTTREVDEEGCVNYMQPVDLDEPLSIKWRMGVGDAISVALQLDASNKQSYVLRGFPSGYRMFDHHKGKAEAPRHDVYLFGSDSRARFRSVPEFIPHAIWLMGDGNVPCKCKYCSKKPQREITSSMGGILRVSHSPSPSRPHRPKTEKVGKKEKGLGSGGRHLGSKGVYAGLKTVEPPHAFQLPQPGSHIQKNSIQLVERNNDLREAIRVPSDGGLPRWFRDGELVWCALENPIMGPGEIGIKFWPAIVDEVKLLIRPEPLPADSVTDDSPPWITHQSTAYKVQFLAISRSYLLPDTMVIPYQSYIAPNEVLHEMVQRPVDDWDFDPDKLSNFDPCPPTSSPPPTFVDTLTPFAVALQIASMLSTFWCLTDEWDAKLSLPQAPTRPIAPPSSLQSAIEAAGVNNASISSGPRPQIPPPQTRTVTQTRFQGIWWGGERLWADDLVRLKVPRNCLAPTGAPHIFAPSGPGPKSRALIDASNADPSEYGGTSRGVFMKLQTIFLVEGGNTGKRECRVSGMLYELADADWEDPNLPRNVESIPSSAALPPSSGQKEPPLPPPPTGYKFRPILATGQEAVMSLSLLSGRYYPRLLQHPLLKTCLSNIIPSDQNTMLQAAHLWALEGLFGGYKNCVDPSKYKAHREKMMTDATHGAMLALLDHVDDRRAQMDVDS